MLKKKIGIIVVNKQKRDCHQGQTCEQIGKRLIVTKAELVNKQK